MLAVELSFSKKITLNRHVHSYKKYDYLLSIVYPFTTHLDSYDDLKTNEHRSGHITLNRNVFTII